MSGHSFVIWAESLQPYSPPRHKGTVNRKLVGRDNVSAKSMEVILGEIQPSGLAETHYHDAAEQAIYLLDGKCIVEVEEEKQDMKPGDTAFFPPGKRHSIKPVDGPIKILVVYSPPLVDVATSFKT